MISVFLVVVVSIIFSGQIESGSTCDIDEPVVLTQHGLIQGKLRNESGFVFEEFLGIRYGVSERFKYSQVNRERWNGVVRKTMYGPKCKQLKDPMSEEDCLFINIWRPLIPETETDSSLIPVFVWVHGSGYQIGSGAMNPGGILASYGNMIVATINYRLGSLGYAYGDENEIPGNQGVSDVITALHWIRQNIAFFHGNSKEVTLAGHSAGSMIISMFPVLPDFDHSLYTRLLLSSGVSLGSMFLEDKSVSLAKTKLLASNVGCGSDTPGPLTKETISCLQTANASALLVNDFIKPIGASDAVAFFPIYGTPLVPQSLINLFWSSVNSVPRKKILFYLQADETGFRTIDLQPNSKSEAYRLAFSKLNFIVKDLSPRTMRPFWTYYFNDVQEHDSKALRTALTNFLNDQTFRCTSLMLAELYSVHHSVRFAEFQYILDKYGKEERPDGAWHDDISELFFGEPLNVGKGIQAPFEMEPKPYSYQDRQKSLRLMKTLADFAWGIEPNDWPELHFNSSNPEKEPVIREINVYDRNVEYSKQHICLEWSKFLNYNIIPNMSKHETYSKF